MTAMPQERRETVLITAIGASILLLVLVAAFLVYQTLPAEDEAAETLPVSTSVPAQPAEVPPDDASADATPSSPEAGTPAGTADERPATVDGSAPGRTTQEEEPDKEG